jgi:hypothetical protein
MHKIEDQMMMAIFQGKNWNKDDTRVECFSRSGAIDHLFFVFVNDQWIAGGAVFGKVIIEKQFSTLVVRDDKSKVICSRLRALGFDVAVRNGVAYIDGIPA